MYVQRTADRPNKPRRVWFPSPFSLIIPLADLSARSQSVFVCLIRNLPPLCFCGPP